MNGIRAVRHAVEAQKVCLWETQPNMELFQRTELVTPKLKVVALHDRGGQGLSTTQKFPLRGLHDFVVELRP